MGSKKRIMMVLLTNEFPPDIRVEKEAKALTRAGYEVFILTIKAKSKKKREKAKNIEILRIFSFKDLILTYMLHLPILIFLIPLLSLIWDTKILHAHDLPHSIIVTIIGKILRKKVIVDLHEDFVGACSLLIQERRSKVLKLLVGVAAFLEKVCCRLATKVIVVSEEDAYRIKELGVPSKKIVCVRNTVDMEAIDKINFYDIRNNSLKDKFLITYIGGLRRHRGLDTLIKALPLILNEIPNAHLLIVGEGKFKYNLIILAKKLGLSKHITFTGYVSFADAMRYLKYSNVSVVPLLSTRDTEKALPHKLFQSMYLAKPLLLSDVGTFRRIVKECRCGVVFKSGNPKDLAKKVVELKSKYDLEELGKNGREAVLKKYNWNIDGRILMNTYDEIVKN
jgi:glycosyltransferase involved in cell wall biosynthesis